MSTLPYAHGGPPLTAQLRAAPADFVVEEVLGYDADGDGEHVLLTVEKTGANTEWVARELACFAGVAPLAVGYAGMKDRHAVTRQSFSVQLGARAEPDWTALPHAEVRVLASARHRRKLKRGALAGNRFALVLRDVQGDRDAAEHTLAAIATRGVPNYFGEQRFGRGGANVERARAMFAGKRVDRALRGLLLSAGRAEVFNALLAARVERMAWDAPLSGELWNLDGSRSWFGPEPWSEALAARMAAFDIHPSGPLWGEGPHPAADDVAALEQAIAATLPELCAGLASAGLQHERRALRLRPAAWAWNWRGDAALELRFTLPVGAYATVVVRELAAV